jgi:hypothetical protein
MPTPVEGPCIENLRDGNGQSRKKDFFLIETRGNCKSKQNRGALLPAECLLVNSSLRKCALRTRKKKEALSNISNVRRNVHRKGERTKLCSSRVFIEAIKRSRSSEDKSAATC